MFDLTSADLAGAVRFLCSSTDGDDSSLFCLGRKVHARVAESPSWMVQRGGPTVEFLRSCDGSCVEKIDVRKLIDELSVGNDDGRDRGGSLLLDGAIRRLLRSNEPLVGSLFKRSYAKRFDQWDAFCLDGRHHVKVKTAFTWAFEEDGGFDHSVCCDPCDGSCKAPIVLDRKVIRDILRQCRAMASD